MTYITNYKCVCFESDIQKFKLQLRIPDNCAKLDISEGGIDYYLLPGLCQALRIHGRIESLNLARNGLGTRGAERLSGCIKANPQVYSCLKEIRLGDNNIGDAGLIKMVEALKGLSKIEIVDLQCCNISSASLNDILNMIKATPTIQIIDLRDNLLSQEDVERFELVVSSLNPSVSILAGGSYLPSMVAQYQQHVDTTSEVLSVMALSQDSSSSILKSLEEEDLHHEINEVNLFINRGYSSSSFHPESSLLLYKSPFSILDLVTKAANISDKNISDPLNHKSRDGKGYNEPEESSTCNFSIDEIGLLSELFEAHDLLSIPSTVTGADEEDRLREKMVNPYTVSGGDSNLYRDYHIISQFTADDAMHMGMHRRVENPEVLGTSALSPLLLLKLRRCSAMLLCAKEIMYFRRHTHRPHPHSHLTTSTAAYEDVEADTRAAGAAVAAERSEVKEIAFEVTHLDLLSDQELVKYLSKCNALHHVPV